MIVVVVGRSGSGKSTFVEAMEVPEFHCVLSRPLLEGVRSLGQEVNHDNIHSLAKKWYAANSWWQVEYVQSQLGDKKFLILDGLRYARELERLRELFGNNLVVVKVESASEARFERLKQRRKVPLSGRAEFERLEADESKDMDLEELLAEADIAVENNDSLTSLQTKARRFASLLRPFVT